MRRTSLTITLVLLVGLLTSACQPIVAPAPESAAPGLQAEVFVTGVPHSSANGIYCGPDGNLYIASVGGHEILIMDPETGAVLKRLGEEVGVTSPDDLTFGPDGSLYWTNLNGGYEPALGESNNFSAASHNACLPRFAILWPRKTSQANAGAPASPDKILVQVSTAVQAH